MLMLTVFSTATLTFAQQFDGVTITGDMPTILNKYREKGWKLIKTEPTFAVLTGSIAQYRGVELYISVTPKSKRVYKATVYLPKQTTWSNLKYEYTQFVENMTVKYGSPESFQYFKEPYYEGDGYEESALKNEKVVWISFWETLNLNLTVEITKYMQVCLTYENPVNVKYFSKERDALLSEKFSK